MKHIFLALLMLTSCSSAKNIGKATYYTSIAEFINRTDLCKIPKNGDTICIDMKGKTAVIEQSLDPTDYLLISNNDVFDAFVNAMNTALSLPESVSYSFKPMQKDFDFQIVEKCGSDNCVKIKIGNLYKFDGKIYGLLQIKESKTKSWFIKLLFDKKRITAYDIDYIIQ